MADEVKHPIRHVLDQVIAAEGQFTPRDDVKDLAVKVRELRNSATVALSSIYAAFGKVCGPEAADLDAEKQVAAFRHLADLTDDIEKRTNAFISIIMSQSTAYKVPPQTLPITPPSGGAVSLEIQANVIPNP
jgi:hypothetical protein